MSVDIPAHRDWYIGPGENLLIHWVNIRWTHVWSMSSIISIMNVRPLQRCPPKEHWGKKGPRDRIVWFRRLIAPVVWFGQKFCLIRKFEIAHFWCRLQICSEPKVGAKRCFLFQKKPKLFDTNLDRAAPPGAAQRARGAVTTINIHIYVYMFAFFSNNNHLVCIYTKNKLPFIPPRPKMAPNLTPLCPRPGTAHRSRPNGMSVEYRENNVLDSNEHFKNR